MSDDYGTPEREQSTIQFPYADLDEAIRLAKQILDAGAVPLDRDQLASVVGQVPRSGAFGAKVSAGRMFGLIDNITGKYQLTELGFEILDPARAPAAKATAFLNVPLYRKLYEDFKGRQLPPKGPALENLFVSMGVAIKQKERARRTFESSARSAQFFNATEDRLVLPVGSNHGIRTGPDPASQPLPPPPPPPPPTAPPPAAQDPVSVLVSIIDMATMSEEEQQAVWTLIRYLKRREAEA